MYRVSIDPQMSKIPDTDMCEVTDMHEDKEGRSDEKGEPDAADIDTEKNKNEKGHQHHQIVKETEDMIEINLSQEDEDAHSELAKKDKQSKMNDSKLLARAEINSNEQLAAAASAMANGASIIYMLQVIVGAHEL